MLSWTWHPYRWLRHRHSQAAPYTCSRSSNCSCVSTRSRDVNLPFAFEADEPLCQSLDMSTELRQVCTRPAAHSCVERSVELVTSSWTRKVLELRLRSPRFLTSLSYAFVTNQRSPEHKRVPTGVGWCSLRVALLVAACPLMNIDIFFILPAGTHDLVLVPWTCSSSLRTCQEVFFEWSPRGNKLKTPFKYATFFGSLPACMSFGMQPFKTPSLPSPS